MDKVMMLVFFNDILEEETEKILKKQKTEGYSIIDNVKGKGVHSGYHLGNNIFPDLNKLLIVVGEKENIEVLKTEFKTLKETYPEEGVKIFLIPVIEAI